MDPGISRPSQTILYSNQGSSPLGQITLIASIEHGRGIVPALPLRVYGSYAVVAITQGEGMYRDAQGIAQEIRAGSLISVYPELAHTYGPNSGQTWSEFYVVFRGPMFDSLRMLGILNAKQPVRHVSSLDGWLARIRSLITLPSATEGARSVQVCHLVTLLTELHVEGVVAGNVEQRSNFMTRACYVLSQDLAEDDPMETFAARAGLSYETFRKRFQAECGVSPAQFRAGRRIEAACDLMQYTGMTNAQIADALGFSDEYHFSKRFKQLRGETPSAFRRRFVG